MCLINHSGLMLILEIEAGPSTTPELPVDLVDSSGDTQMEDWIDMEPPTPALAPISAPRPSPYVYIPAQTCTDLEEVQIVTCPCKPVALLLVENGVFPVSPTKVQTGVSIDLLEVYRTLFECSCDAITTLAAALQTIYDCHGFRVSAQRAVLGYINIKERVRANVDAALTAAEPSHPPPSNPLMETEEPLETSAPLEALLDAEAGTTSLSDASRNSSSLPDTDIWPEGASRGSSPTSDEDMDASHSSPPPPPPPPLTPGPSLPPPMGVPQSSPQPSPPPPPPPLTPGGLLMFYEWGRSLKDGGDVQLGADGCFSYRHLRSAGHGPIAYDASYFVSKEKVAQVDTRINEVLFLCDIDTLGEQQKYIVALMEEMNNHLSPQATILQSYDFGCVTDHSFNLFPILREGFRRRFCLQLAFSRTLAPQRRRDHVPTYWRQINELSKALLNPLRIRPLCSPRPPLQIQNHSKACHRSCGSIQTSAKDAEGQACGQAHCPPVCAGSKLGSKSGGASETGAALESGGDLPTAKGKGKRVEFAPSPAFHISSPAQFRGVINDFLDANNFEEQPLPPLPPVGYHAPEVSNDTDTDAGGDVDAGSDTDANTGACRDDPQCPPLQHGRFSAAQKKALTDCFANIEEAVATCALSANLPASRVVNTCTHQCEGANMCTNNGWNLYQTFAQSTPEQRLLERRCVDPVYEPPEDGVTPIPHPQQILDVYQVFKGKFSKEQMDAVLMMAAELAKNEVEQDQTLQQHQMSPNVNEDAELGGIIKTKGLKTVQFVEDIASTEGDLLTAAKLTAYPSNMKGLQLVNIPSASASATAMAVTAQEPPALPDPPESPAPDAPSNKKGQGKASRRRRWQALPTGMQSICITDLGVNVFEKDNSNFGLNKAARELAANNSILTNWPADICLPHLYPKNKVLSALRLLDIRSLNEAMDARETAGQGLRFELMKEPYTTGGYIIFTHNYRKYTPPGPSSAQASVKHRRSSSSAILPCSNGENIAYEVHYDLRNPLPRQIILTGELVTKSTSTCYAPLAPLKAKVKAKKSKSKGGKGKRKVVSEDDNESEPYELEEEEPTSPHLRKSSAPTRLPIQEGGSALPVCSQCCAAIAANKVIGEDEDMSDDDHLIAMSKASRFSRVRPRTVDSSESESERPAVCCCQVFNHVSIPPSPVRDAPATRRRNTVCDDRHVYNNAGQPLGMAYKTGERGRYKIQWTVPPVALSSPHPTASSFRLFIVNAPDARRLLERPTAGYFLVNGAATLASSLRPTRSPPVASTHPPPTAPTCPPPIASRGLLLAAPSSMEPPSVASSSRPTCLPPRASALSTRPPPGASSLTRPPPGASSASTRVQLDGSSSKKPVPSGSRCLQATAPPSGHAEIPDRGPRPSLPGIATINDKVPMQRLSSPGPAEAEAQSAEELDPTSEMMCLLSSMTPQQMQAMLGMMAQASQAAPHITIAPEPSTFREEKEELWTTAGGSRDAGERRVTTILVGVGLVQSHSIT
ncbi:hypothetical protein DFH08DRAFT_812693 [Mycena albidolilacea]|uniref:Uncharacterized protein n=1 Tax=Mycena albidolilacea TaxID=1033008 RepID=A0AAD7EMV6_9AGAR|nr:hypothetical protein DFH08DRAFT_812693 [Mycena albidolilacea]